MLVLSRKVGEKIRVGDNIVITVLRVWGNRVRIGIEAPPDVLILRHELDIDLPDDPDQHEGKVA